MAAEPIAYEEWLQQLNALTLAAHCMSIYELEDDIPRETLREAYEQGISTQVFAENMVRPIFYPEGSKP